MADLKLTYWTKRWGAKTTITLEPIDEGWLIRAAAHSGKTNFEGHPHLYGNFNQDYVCYPMGFDTFLAFVRQELCDEHIDMVRAQQMLDELGDWVTSCEQSQPRWKGWNDAG